MWQHSVDNPVPSISNFGYTLHGISDVNGDGYGEVVVGDPYGCLSGSCLYYKGTVTLLSGLEGATIWSVESEEDCDKVPSLDHIWNQGCNFGFSLGSTGDLDEDNKEDIIVGAQGYDGFDPDGANPTEQYYQDVGKVYVYSSSDGSLLWAKNAGLIENIDYGYGIGVKHDG